MALATTRRRLELAVDEADDAVVALESFQELDLVDVAVHRFIVRLVQ